MAFVERGEDAGQRLDLPSRGGRQPFGKRGTGGEEVVEGQPLGIEIAADRHHLLAVARERLAHPDTRRDEQRQVVDGPVEQLEVQCAVRETAAQQELDAAIDRAGVDGVGVEIALDAHLAGE